MKLYGQFGGKFGPKYGNKKVSHAGYSFASRMEAEGFDLLKLLEAAGELKDIRHQVHVKLTDAKITYIADFKAFDVKRNCDIWIEIKGFQTPEWRLKKRLWEHYGPGPLLIYMKKGTLFLAEEIIPK